MTVKASETVGRWSCTKAKDLAKWRHVREDDDSVEMMNIILKL